MIKVGIPVWQGRVSPVFDTAQHLLVIELDKGIEINRKMEPLGTTIIPTRATKVAEIGIKVLICGAISQSLADLLSDSGINIFPFINGEVEAVLKAYLEGQLPNPQFMMPGCCGRRKRRRGKHRRNYFNNNDLY